MTNKARSRRATLQEVFEDADRAIARPLTAEEERAAGFACLACIADGDKSGQQGICEVCQAHDADR